MDVSQASEQRLQSSCISRWRSADFTPAFGQELLSSSAGGGGGGGGVAVAAAGAASSAAGDCKLEIDDDTILCDLMDLDPLPGETWMGNNQSDFNVIPYVNFSQSSSFSPSLSSSSSAAATTLLYPHCSVSSAYLLQALDEHSALALMEHQVHGSAAEPNMGSSTTAASICSEPGAEFSASTFMNNPAAAGGGFRGERANLSQMFLSPHEMMMPRTTPAEESDPLVSETQCCGGGGEKVVDEEEEEVGGSNNPAGVVERRMIAPAAIEGKMARSCESTAAATDMGNYNSSRRPMIRTDSIPFSLRERLLQALRYIGRSRPDALVQVWMPVTQGNNKLFLTTRDQPYVLERKNDQLWSFRSVSEKYDFPAGDNNNKESTGAGGGGDRGFFCCTGDLPVRVFLNQAPEWTPNVQLYSSAEYLRVEEAQRYDVRGTVSVPVLNPVSRTCLAVIELVTKTERIQYRPEIDIICRALQVGSHCVPYRISDDHHPVSVVVSSLHP
jgi:hypothetical protein